ncbi:MAG: hypothetical protein JRD05_11785 [Deltaproteobacteria bacterium]|nr:hypothetical protein [Deltaproteobacteria bacterium]
MKTVKAKFLRVSEEINALDFLEKAGRFILETENNPLAWKWVTISLHGALYGFAICACKGTNPERVIDFKSKHNVFHTLGGLPAEIEKEGFPKNLKIEFNPKKKRIVFKGAMSNDIRNMLLSLSKNPPYQKAINEIYLKSHRLISFDEAIKRCQDPSRMKMTIMSKPLQLTNEQKESIEILKHMLRNNFEHFIPKAWSIEIHGMPQITIDVLDVIRFLAIETGNYILLNSTKIRKVKSIVFQSKRFLKKSKLYKEALVE